jgi:hypothetical protein
MDLRIYATSRFEHFFSRKNLRVTAGRTLAAAVRALPLAAPNGGDRPNQHLHRRGGQLEAGGW